MSCTLFLWVVNANKLVLVQWKRETSESNQNMYVMFFWLTCKTVSEYFPFWHYVSCFCLLSFAFTAHTPAWIYWQLPLVGWIILTYPPILIPLSCSNSKYEATIVSRLAELSTKLTGLCLLVATWQLWGDRTAGSWCGVSRNSPEITPLERLDMLHLTQIKTRDT